MSFPDTTLQAADRILERIELGADDLALPPTHFEEDDEHRAFRLSAEVGARAYAASLRRWIEAGEVNDAIVEEAGLVAAAAQCAGWLGTSGVATGHGGAVDELVDAGVFTFCPAVPGKWVACYRLVAS